MTSHRPLLHLALMWPNKCTSSSIKIRGVLTAVADMKYLFGCFNETEAGFRLQLSCPEAESGKILKINDLRSKCIFKMLLLQNQKSLAGFCDLNKLQSHCHLYQF